MNLLGFRSPKAVPPKTAMHMRAAILILKNGLHHDTEHCIEDALDDLNMALKSLKEEKG